MQIHAKRVYESPSLKDGKRYLVERLWPRGMRKEALRMDGWLKDVAPSAALRTWYDSPAYQAAAKIRWGATISNVAVIHGMA